MKLAKATFAAGCFWGVQFYFDQVPGVISSRVGYTGGHKENPTYEEVCAHTTGHAEAVELTYDPAQVIAGNSSTRTMQSDDEYRTESYMKFGEGGVESSAQQGKAYRILLKHFFRIHDPTQLNRQGPDIGDNYRSAIFYHSDEQKNIAGQVRAELVPSFDSPIVTQIVPASTFYEAEDFHQKYTEKTGGGMCPIPYQPLV